MLPRVPKRPPRRRQWLGFSGWVLIVLGVIALVTSATDAMGDRAPSTTHGGADGGIHYTPIAGPRLAQFTDADRQRATQITASDQRVTRLLRDHPFSVSQIDPWYDMNGSLIGAVVTVSLDHASPLTGNWLLASFGSGSRPTSVNAYNLSFPLVRAVRVRVDLLRGEVVTVEPAGHDIRATPSPAVAGLAHRPSRGGGRRAKERGRSLSYNVDPGTGGSLAIVEVSEDRFYNWDYSDTSSTAYSNTDFPITFVFLNNAEIDKVKNALYMYGQSIGNGTEYADLNDGGGWNWDSDNGKKDGCFTFGDDTHYREYAAPTDRMYNVQWGFYTLASTHYDHDECNTSGTEYGWSEDAEHNLASNASTVWPGYVWNDAIYLSNAVISYWIGDHYYQSDGYAGEAVVP